MNISQNGMNMVKKFEGCELHAYQDIVGVWTIGYGHTAGVKSGQVITQAQADKMFADEITQFASKVASLIKVPVNQNQFDALVSFAYNLGVQALADSSLLKYVNAKNFTAAADEFPKWCHARGKLNQGLLTRRQIEEKLFLTPMPKPAPKVVPPAPVYHNVVSGDTLTKIASEFHTTIDSLCKLNKIDANDILSIGYKMRVK
jgi:lysozyme